MSLSYSYIIASGSTAAQLENKVLQLHVSGGYQAFGGICVEGGVFYQAMIRYDHVAPISGSQYPIFVNPR